MTEQNINIFVKPNKYHNGKIYTIRSPHTDKYYIGSTCNTLSKRFSQHNCQFSSSKIIIDYGDAYIELLENFKCENKNELNKREGELIRLHKENIVNYLIAGRSQKDYNNDNKETINNYRRNYGNQKINCPICNIKISYDSLSRHKKRKHIEKNIE